MNSLTKGSNDIETQTEKEGRGNGIYNTIPKMAYLSMIIDFYFISIFLMTFILFCGKYKDCNSSCINYNKLVEFFPDNHEVREKCADTSEGINYVCSNYAHKYCESKSKICAGKDGGEFSGWDNYYYECQKNGKMNGFICKCKPNYNFMFGGNIIVLVLFALGAIPILFGCAVGSFLSKELQSICCCTSFIFYNGIVITFCGLIMVANVLSMKTLVSDNQYIVMWSSVFILVVKSIIAQPIYGSLKEIKQQINRVKNLPTV
jgi:hypothetical protein